MSITLTPYRHQQLCYGHAWTIDNEDILAGQLASIALGHALHVQKILSGAGLSSGNATQNQIVGALELLTVQGTDPWHRDGWMFQAMSWIAAHRATPGGIITFPHMIHAHKGFDGLQIELDRATGRVVAAVIFEDKATDRPRDTIRDVWTDFKELETGARENVLVADVTTLLRTQPGINADAAIETIIWKEVRRYRVCITVGDTHANEHGRARLFAGYDGVAPGDIDRRRAEIFEVQHLRPWMERLAQRAITVVRTRATDHV
jgi:hypothetical protein